MTLSWSRDFGLVTWLWARHVTLGWSRDFELVTWLWAGDVTLGWSHDFELVTWLWAGHMTLSWSRDWAGDFELVTWLSWSRDFELVTWLWAGHMTMGWSHSQVSQSLVIPSLVKAVWANCQLFANTVANWLSTLAGSDCCRFRLHPPKNNDNHIFELVWSLARLHT